MNKFFYFIQCITLFFNPIFNNNNNYYFCQSDGICYIDDFINSSYKFDEYDEIVVLNLGYYLNSFDYPGEHELILQLKKAEEVQFVSLKYEIIADNELPKVELDCNLENIEITLKNYYYNQDFCVVYKNQDFVIVQVKKSDDYYYEKLQIRPYSYSSIMRKKISFYGSLILLGIILLEKTIVYLYRKVNNLL